LMHHLIRKATVEGGRIVLGGITKGGEELLGIPEFRELIGVTALTPLRGMEIDGRHVEPFQNVIVTPDEAVSIAIDGLKPGA
ncbi:hypothetical protein DRP77_06980, partial [Candidatus Poribacteria bacterium]